MPCPGLTPNTETCGGPSRLSLWSLSATTPPSTPLPQPITTTPGQLRPYLTGYITEPAGARALSGRSAASPSAMTLAGCGAFCFGSGFKYYGTEYGSECWCGDAVHANATAVAAEGCAMKCSGAAGEVCGGARLISVFEWY